MRLELSRRRKRPEQEKEKARAGEGKGQLPQPSGPCLLLSPLPLIHAGLLSHQPHTFMHPQRLTHPLSLAVVVNIDLRPPGPPEKCRGQSLAPWLSQPGPSPIRLLLLPKSLVETSGQTASPVRLHTPGVQMQ